jgi:small-conductance mechanosensitive channel
MATALSTRPNRRNSPALARFAPHRFALMPIVAAVCLALLTGAAAYAQALNAPDVLAHLNALINWYRDATTKPRGIGLPSDTLFLQNIQSLAAEAVRLGFQSARAEAGLLNVNPGPPQPTETTGEQHQLSQVQATVAARVSANQAQIEKLNKQIAAASGAKKKSLTDQRDKLQGEVDLDHTLQDAIQKMAAFVESSESSNQGLTGSVNRLQRSLPEVFGGGLQNLSPNPNPKQNESQQQKPAAQVAQPRAVSQSSGLIGESIQLYEYLIAVRDIEQLESETKSLRDTVEQLRKPLHDEITQTIQRGQQLSNEAAGQAGQAGSKNAAGPTRQDFDALSDRFKQLAAASLPLSQEIVTLDQVTSNLDEWRTSIFRESRSVVHALVFHVAAIGVALAIVFILSEMWRRFTFRYIREPRRRRQFLVLRRFVTGFLVSLVLILGFVSEFSSLATFAGFATAGVAVALQSVLLSVAAYFFLIGRYGIRVGDRISVSGVTGDVAEIGLVRLYLLELGGSGIDLFPTGRVVVFSNSVLFQPTTPLYKQIPGTEYTWHEVAMALAPGTNHKAVEQEILQTVNSVFHNYREDIERQHDYVQQRMDVHLTAPGPQSQIIATDAGLELVVRYPVAIRQTAQVDAQVTAAVLDAISRDDELKTAISGSPRIRASVKG